MRPRPEAGIALRKQMCDMFCAARQPQARSSISFCRHSLLLILKSAFDLNLTNLFAQTFSAYLCRCGGEDNEVQGKGH